MQGPLVKIYEIRIHFVLNGKLILYSRLVQSFSGKEVISFGGRAEIKINGIYFRKS